MKEAIECPRSPRPANDQTMAAWRLQPIRGHARLGSRRQNSSSTGPGSWGATTQALVRRTEAAVAGAVGADEFARGRRQGATLRDEEVDAVAFATKDAP